MHGNSSIRIPGCDGNGALYHRVPQAAWGLCANQHRERQDNPAGEAFTVIHTGVSNRLKFMQTSIRSARPLNEAQHQVLSREDSDVSCSGSKFGNI